MEIMYLMCGLFLLASIGKHYFMMRAIKGDDPNMPETNEPQKEESADEQH